MLTLSPLEQVGLTVLPPDVALTYPQGFPFTVGDFVVDPVTGLRAVNPIATAIVLCLFTDARVPDELLRFEHAGDRRGWVGDGYDIDASRGETELGSYLWIYRRSELTDETGRAIEDEARRALDTLIRQGVVARFDVQAQVAKAEGVVRLSVGAYRADGTQIAAARFDPLWSTARNGL